GPYVSSPPEVFDTAMVLLALARLKDRREVQPMMARGRTWLLAAQNEDGTWRETTRPPGAESYAQRLSTTGWATLALLSMSRDNVSWLNKRVFVDEGYLTANGTFTVSVLNSR